MKEFWNERYGQSDYVYGKEANSFFTDQLAKLPTGKLLLPAEGEGRNAVHAALNGWEVTAFDFSEEGKNKALGLAKENDVRLDYRLLNASDFHATESYDAIALIFAHFAGKEKIRLFKELEKSLAPNGYLIMEVFSKNQLGNKSGGPKDIDLLYSKNEIKQLFPTLNFTIFEEMKIELDEGAFHQGEAEVIRVVAQKV